MWPHHVLSSARPRACPEAPCSGAPGGAGDVTTRRPIGGGGAEPAAALRRRRPRFGSRSRPWPSAAAPRCSRTTPSRYSPPAAGGRRRRARARPHTPCVLQDPTALQPRPGPAALDSYNPFESGAVSGAGRGRFPPAFPLHLPPHRPLSSPCSRRRPTRRHRRPRRRFPRPGCPRRKRPRSPRGEPAPRSPATTAPTARRYRGRGQNGSPSEEKLLN